MPDAEGRHSDEPCLIIPARFASTRFPGKPLVKLTGRNGQCRTLIEWTWRAARRVTDAAQIRVATDDRRIIDEVERFGGVAVLTPSHCANGTERCAAAVADMAIAPALVVNFQGDAPLTPAYIVRATIERLRDDPELATTTPAIPCRGGTYAHLKADSEAGRVGGTTVVFNRRGHALYFSKNIIPFVPPGKAGVEDLVHLHLGIYAYRPDALAAYAAAPPSALEELEGLEQLRLLDLGLPVGVVVCDPPSGSTIELNNPTDVVLMEPELL